MPFKEYAAELQRNLRTGHATEPSYYPALKSLLESLDSSVAALQNPKKTEHGSPDFRVVRKETIDFRAVWIGHDDNFVWRKTLAGYNAGTDAALL